MKLQASCLLKIILGCRFSSEAYAKNVREKATIVLFKNYWGSVHMFLSKFHINRGTIAPSCFKSHTNYWYFVFFQKKVCLMSGLKFILADVTSFLPDNLSGLFKKITFRPGMYSYYYIILHLFLPHFIIMKVCFWCTPQKQTSGGVLWKRCS